MTRTGEPRVVRTIEGTPTRGDFRVETLVDGTHMTLLEIELDAGTASALHAHDHESILYVVRGRLRSEAGGTSVELGPGDTCVHEAGVPHLVEALEASVFVEVKSPAQKMDAIFRD